MTRPLPANFFRLFFLSALVAIGISFDGFSQGCGGADGTGVFTGGAVSTNSGFLCANRDALGGAGSGAIIDLSAGNIASGDKVTFVVDWDDGSGSPILAATQTGANTWTLTNLKHIFPTSGANVKCQYVATVTLRINGIPCISPFGSPPVFTRWNVDDQNSGKLVLQESVTGATTYYVCKGTQTTVTFTDNSTLNCVPPEATPNNTLQRWRRFTYGTTNTITSATGVQIGGVVKAYPFQDAVLNAPAPVVSPVPPPTTQSITIPADAQVGQEFDIMMEYWNTCNPYPVGTSVTATARIIVVDQPPSPTANVSAPVCSGAPVLPNYSITLPGGFTSSVVTWFQDNAGVPGAVIPGFTGTTLPASAVSPAINNTVPGVYRVWASYYGVNNIQGKSCESARIPVTFTIREALSAPTIPVLPASVCSTDPPLNITLAAPATETNGGATQYNWTIPSDITTSFTPPNAVDLTFSGVNFGGAAFVDRVLNVSRRYSSAPNCSSPQSSATIRVYAPSTKGTTTGGGSFCQGSDAGSITWTPGRGSIIRWEVSTNGGLTFTTDAGLGTSNPAVIGTSLAPGTFIYRAVIQNGACSTVNSDNVTFTISPNPGAASVGPNQALCQALLTSNPLGGNTPPAGSGQWTMISGPGTVTFAPDDLTPNATASVSTQGVYKFRWTVTSGICVSFADIQVDFGTNPGPQNAGTDNAFCGLTGALNATAPLIGTGQWSLVSSTPVGTVTFADDKDRNSAITASGYGVYVFRWTVTSGNCAPVTDDVQITFSKPATASVTSDFISCLDLTALSPINITGTVGGGAAIGEWKISSGAGTFTSSGASVGSSIAGPTINDSYMPVLGDTVTGIVLQLVALDPDGIGPCADVTSSPLTITIDKKPRNVNAGPDQLLICASSTTLAARPPVNGTGTWTGPGGISFNNPAIRNTTANGISIGSTITLHWNVQSALSSSPGGCAVVTDDVNLFRNALPSVTNLTPPVCELSSGSGTATVVLSDQDNAVTGSAPNTSVEWFTDPIPAGPVTPSNTPQNLDTASPNSLNFFTRVTNSATTCQNTGTVTYTVNPLPFVNTTFSKSFCEDFPVGSGKASNIDLTASDIKTVVTGGAANRSIAWFEDATATTMPIATPTSYNITSSTVVYARVKNTITGCENIAPVTLNITQRPLSQAIQGKSTVCLNGQESYRINTVASATYQWTIPALFTKFLGGSPADNVVLLDFPSVGQDTIRLKVTVNGCQSAEMKKSVTVSPTPAGFGIVRTDKNPALTITTDAVCENDTGVPYAVLPNNFPGSTYNWEVSPLGSALVANGQTSGNVLINFLSTSAYPSLTLTVTESNSSNCFGPPQSVVITVNPRPDLADVNASVCSNSASGVVFSTNGSVAAATYNITSVSVDPGLIPATRPTAAGVLANAIAADVFENTTGGALQVRYTVEPVSADGCAGPAKIISVTVKPQPVLDPFLNVSKCSGKTTDVLFKVQVGSVAADKYFIDAINPDPGLTATAGSPVAGPSPVNANEIADDVWQNLGTTPLNVVYMVRPSNSLLGCVGNPAVPVTITAYPEPQVTPQTATICSGDNVNMTLASNIGTTFSWTVKTVVGGVTGASGGIGTKITDVLTNTSGAPGTVTYTVIAKNPASLQSCEGPPLDITVTVNPAPPVTNISQTVCSNIVGGNSIPLDLTSLQSSINGSAGLTFAWFADAALTSPIASPSTYVMSNAIPVFARVDNGPATCFNVATVNYAISPKPQVLANATLFNGYEIKCNGDASGQINASASQGTSPYLYSDDGGTTFFPVGTFNSLAPGNYTIRVKDSKGCINDSPVVPITEPAPLAIGVNVTDALCFGSATGIVEVNSVSGGIAGTYQYSLNGGAYQVSNTFNNLSAANYTVTVKDGNGCTKSTSAVVGQPTQLTGTIQSQTNIDCNGNNNGSITVTGAGGVTSSPYQYAIDGLHFQTINTFNTLVAGSYTISIRDANSCQIAVPVVITQPATLTLNLTTKVDVACFGNSSGEIHVAAFGGTTPYQYSVNGGTTFQATGDFTGLPGGIAYHLVVKDAHACTALLDVNVNQPPVFTAFVVNQTNALCNGTATGSVTVSGTGGSGVYQYAKDSGPFGASGTFTGLAAGGYVINVKDQNGCTVLVNITITEPTVLTASKINQTNVSCAGGTNGDVTIAGAGGTAPYQYSIDGIVYNSTGFFSNLSHGSYTVNVRDANLVCTTSVAFTINEPSPLVISAIVTPTACKSEASGKVLVNVSDGTAPYLYSIDGVNFQSSNAFNGLASGNYLVRVKDANNCPVNTSIVITEPTQVVVVVQSKTDVDCKGNLTGVVSLVASGGNAASYTYSKDDVVYGSSSTFPALPAAAYTFYAKDANGCKGQVNANVNEPSALTLTLNTRVDVLCNGQSTGSIVVDGGGGNAPYQYSIDGGLFTPLNTFNSLAAKGSYLFTVKDAKNCIQTLNVPITQPTPIVVSSSTGTDVSCFLGSDGTITIAGAGGTPAYSYTVLQDPGNISGKTSGAFVGLRAGTYTVQLTDNNNCSINASPIVIGQPSQLQVSALVSSNFNGFGVSCEGKQDGEIRTIVMGGVGPTFTYTMSPDPNSTGSNTNGIFAGLGTGFYAVNVKDSKGCLATSVPVYINEPPTLLGGFIGYDQFVCVGSDPAPITEIVSPFGGLGPGTYSYQWKSSIDNVNFSDIIGATSSSFDPPPTVTQTTYFKRFVRSGVGGTSGTCTAKESNVETLTINPLPSADIKASGSPICEGGNLFLNLTFTGQAPFKFDYTATTSAGVTNFTNQIGSASFPIPKFDFKDTTTYTITRVKDFNGCESHPNVSAKVDVTKVNSDFSVGAPTAQCTGSTYTFNWKADANVNYQWLWPDGTVDNITSASPGHSVGDNSISHVLTNGLTSTSINLPVKLIATGGTNNACQDSTTIPVKVFSAVKAILPPVDNSICSGTTLSFDNLTQGATINKWFYREKGTATVGNVTNTYQTSYQFTNTTTQNPIVYEVIYVGSNATGCSDSDTLDVTVFKNAIANFDIGTIPPYTGGISTVNVTNTSSIIDPANFTYAWNFGILNDVVPTDYTDNATPVLPPVVYHSPGTKAITLTVTNRMNASCMSQLQKPFVIPIPPFSAAFTATPLASCLPTVITVHNLSGAADAFYWELKDFAGNVVAKSNLNEPTFAVSAGGTYSLYLTASLFATGQTATAQINDIEVYENPHAVFEARPNPFFVPDTPVHMYTDNTTGANHYAWNFGDSGPGLTAIDSMAPTHTYLLEGSYTITFYASYDHGSKDIDGSGTLKNVTCYDTATMVVKGRQGGQTRIPNAFSPDPSGPNGGNVTDYTKNDVFLPITRGVEEFEMQIYDRWGTLIFVSKNKSQGWDGYDKHGNLLPAGVYVFKLTMRLSNGQRTTQIGDVTLLR